MRGCNDGKKKTVIKVCLGRWKPDMLYLQESKVESCDRVFIKRIWNCKEVGWDFISAKGAAGGVVLMWNEVKFQCLYRVRGEVSQSVWLKNVRGKGLALYWCILSRQQD